MDSNETFVPSEQSIRQIIRHELRGTKNAQPAAGNRQRKVSFSDNPGRQSRSLRQQKQQRKGSSKSPKGRSKSPRARLPAPQNRQTLSRGKTAFQTDNTTPVRPSSTKLSHVKLTERQSKVLGMGLKFRPSLKPPTEAGMLLLAFSQPYSVRMKERLC